MKWVTDSVGSEKFDCVRKNIKIEQQFQLWEATLNRGENKPICIKNFLNKIVKKFLEKICWLVQYILGNFYVTAFLCKIFYDIKWGSKTVWTKCKFLNIKQTLHFACPLFFNFSHGKWCNKLKIIMWKLFFLSVGSLNWLQLQAKLFRRLTQLVCKTWHKAKLTNYEVLIFLNGWSVYSMLVLK